MIVNRDGSLPATSPIPPPSTGEPLHIEPGQRRTAACESDTTLNAPLFCLDRGIHFILRPKIKEAIHRFRLRDELGRSLLDHGGIWLLELSKCAIEIVQTEQQRWLKFFTEGERLDDQRLPEWMQTEEMHQAVNHPALKGEACEKQVWVDQPKP